LCSSYAFEFEEGMSFRVADEMKIGAGAPI
jgi:hypothetical protein